MSQKTYRFISSIGFSCAFITGIMVMQKADAKWGEGAALVATVWVVFMFTLAVWQLSELFEELKK